MKIKKLFSLRVSILLIVLLLTLIAINPNPFAEGIVVNYVQPGSTADTAGIVTGERILEINRNPIKDVADFNEEVKKLEIKPINITVKTDKETYDYSAAGNLGFITDQNLTVVSSGNIAIGEKIIEKEKN